MFDPFATLNEVQRAQVQHYEALLLDVNQRINLISRQTDPATVFERHMLHCLTLTQRRFPDGATVVDYGTGGGLPGLLLAIAFPNVSFHLIDSVGKKIRAVSEMAQELGLENVEAHHVRAEQWDGTAHFAVSRATAPLRDLWSWFRRVAKPFEVPQGCWPAGLTCLKGGDLTEEIQLLQKRFPRTRVDGVTDLFTLLERDYFQEKVILTVQMT